MNKEKILEKGKKEMAREEQEQVILFGTRLGSIVFASLAGVYVLLDFQWGKHFSFDVFSLVLVQSACMDFSKYYIYRKKLHLVKCIANIIGVILCILIHFGFIKVW